MGWKSLASALAVAGVLTAGGAAKATTPTAMTAGTVVPSTQTVSFSVFLPLQNTAALKSLVQAQHTKGSPSYHKWLTAPQAAAQFAPSPAAMAQAKATLTAAGLKIVSSNLMSIQVSGTAAQVTKMLQANLRSLPSVSGGQRIVSLNRPILPAALAQLGALVPDLINVPEHHVHSQILAKPATVTPDNRNGPFGGYRYNDMKQAYDYPAYNVLDGTGVNVAIVMSSDALDSDVAAMFNHEHFTVTTGKAPPTIVHVPLFGAQPVTPANAFNNGAFEEASLDTQMVLGGAPGATVSLLNIPNLSDGSIIGAYANIVLSNQYDIVSSSFGECELFYTPAYNNGYDYTPTLEYYDEIFAYGASEGITFVASSGDSGALECVPNNYFIGVPPAVFTKGVSTPAADPYVTAVGGGNLQTTFVASGYLPTAYVAENAFGDPEIPHDPYGLGKLSGGIWGAGGGVSQIFAQPFYQTDAYTGLTSYTGSTTRAVPDVGMQVGGCPGGISVQPCSPDRSYVLVFLDAASPIGGQGGLIGTSVSAPEFAGALALAVQAYGRAGILNYFLYGQGATQAALGGASAPSAAQYFHQGIPGFDGVYTSNTAGGYNFMYGNGSPDVRAMFGLTAIPPAGDPHTITNP